MHYQWVITVCMNILLFCFRLASSPPTTMAPPPTTTPDRPLYEIQSKNIFETPIYRQRDNNTIQFSDKGKRYTAL